jgi:hypothetical protein
MRRFAVFAEALLKKAKKLFCGDEYVVAGRSAGRRVLQKLTPYPPFCASS